MSVGNSFRRNALIVLTLLVVGSTVLLTPQLSFFPHVDLWVRIVLSGLLWVGVAGAIWRMKYFLIAGKIGTWLFLLYAIADLPDPDDFPDFAKLEYPMLYTFSRLILLATVAIGTWICLRQLGRLNHPNVARDGGSV